MITADKERRGEKKRSQEVARTKNVRLKWCERNGGEGIDGGSDNLLCLQGWDPQDLMHPVPVEARRTETTSKKENGSRVATTHKKKVNGKLTTQRIHKAPSKREINSCREWNE